MTSLPADIFHMVNIELARDKDFDSLLHVALSCKTHAMSALSNMYRHCHEAPVTNSGSDELAESRQKLLNREQIYSKWSRLWRTLILSSMDKTVYPYCRYIRVLDLRDLKELLEDPSFAAHCSDDFFAGDLSHLRIYFPQVYTRSRSRRARHLNALVILELVGDMLTKRTPMVEELAGELSSNALMHWLPNLPRLQQMTIFDGAAMADGVGALLRLHCPAFNTLTFYSWKEDDTDHLFAKFLGDINPCMQQLEILSYAWIGAESFLALNCHRDTLTELKISTFPPQVMKHLGLLSGLTNLTILHMAQDRPMPNFEDTHEEVVLEVTAWLRQCKKLEEIFFAFSGAPAILTPLLKENEVKLVDLRVTSYTAGGATEFHRALAHQKTLKSISLVTENGDDCDNAALVTSLAQISGLTHLRLQGVSDSFTDADVNLTIRGLPELEELWISGWHVTDAIWLEMGKLKSLRRLDINATSSFTTAGILKFISGLGPGNQGLSLAVMMGNPSRRLPDEETALIAAAIAAEVDGAFDYTLARGSSHAGRRARRNPPTFMADYPILDPNYTDSDSD